MNSKVKNYKQQNAYFSGYLYVSVSQRHPRLALYRYRTSLTGKHTGDGEGVELCCCTGTRSLTVVKVGNRAVPVPTIHNWAIYRICGVWTDYNCNIL